MIQLQGPIHALSPPEAAHFSQPLTLSLGPLPFGEGYALMHPAGLAALGYHQGDSLAYTLQPLQKTWPKALIQVQPLPAVFAALAEGHWRQPVVWVGTAFQQRVWRALLQVPWGSQISYGHLASLVQCASAQAVGQAVGANPLALLVPCHRVVAAKGLGGYFWGAALKQQLLGAEQAGC